jgi:hypothetical protein
MSSGSAVSANDAKPRRSQDSTARPPALRRLGGHQHDGNERKRTVGLDLPTHSIPRLECCFGSPT